MKALIPGMVAAAVASAIVFFVGEGASMALIIILSMAIGALVSIAFRSLNR